MGNTGQARMGMGVWDEWEDKEDQANALSLRNKETPKKTYCPKIPDAGEVFKPDPDMELWLIPAFDCTAFDVNVRDEEEDRDAAPPMNSSNEDGRKGLVRP